MVGGLRQHEMLRQFCQKNGYEIHDTLQLFRRNQHEPWMLYRRGTKGSQKMPSGKSFPGWTFNKSLGNAEERASYKSVCLNGSAYDGVEEVTWYSTRSAFEKCVQEIRAKRLYIPWEFDRILNPHRRDFIQKLNPNPVFDK